MQKSWHLDRRTFLKGTGVALSLPYLECMAAGSAKTPTAELPRRMCCLYFPFGVALPPEGGEDSDWNWFPKGDGRTFEFRNTLRGLEPLREDVTILGGMSHPHGRKMGGHDTGDIFLTGRNFKECITATRFPSTSSLPRTSARKRG